MANMTTQEILQGIKDWAAPKVIYDISAAHNNTKYADLSDALGTNGGNIPQEYKKGGITVRFVHSTDNKYVQFRCMAQNFTTDVAQWQGVDNRPTVNSKNFVESGGIAEITKGNYTIIEPTNIISGKRVREGELVDTVGMSIIIYEVSPGTTYDFCGKLTTGTTSFFIYWFNSSSQYISKESYRGLANQDVVIINQPIVAPSGAAYLYMNAMTSSMESYNRLRLPSNLIVGDVLRVGKPTEINPIRGKKVSLMGDSNWTFDGISTGFSSRYRPGGVIEDVRDTWWGKMLLLSDAELEVNASVGSSSVTDNERFSVPGYLSRVDTLGNPDCVIIGGGQNEPTDVTIGTFDPSKPIGELDTMVFADAYDKLVRLIKQYYNPEYMLMVIHPKTQDKFTSVMIEIADYYGIDVANLHSVGEYVTYVDNIHYDFNGSQVVCKNVLSRINVETEQSQDTLKDEIKTFTLKETVQDFDNEGVAGYVIDANRKILATIKKDGSINRLVENDKDRHTVHFEDADIEGIRSLIVSNDNQIISAITDKGEVQFYGGGGFAGESVTERRIDKDYVKVLTSGDNQIIGYIDGTGKVVIYDFYSPSLEKTEISVDAAFTALGFTASGADNHRFISDKTYRLLDNAKINYKKSGVVIPDILPCISIHDDDTIDNQIPVSQGGADVAPAGYYADKGGYFSILYPLLKSINEKYKSTIKGKAVCGLAAEGQRTGLTQLGMSDDYTTLNANGNHVNELVEKAGWEVMCHSMTARYMAENYLVNGEYNPSNGDINDTLARGILSYGIWGGTQYSWKTTTVYNQYDGKNYVIRQDKSGWDLLPQKLVKPFCKVIEDASVLSGITTTNSYGRIKNNPLIINPSYTEKYQVEEWFNRANRLGLKNFGKVCISWGSSPSVYYIRERMKYADVTTFPGTGNNDMTRSNVIPMDSCLTRILYTPSASRNGVSDPDTKYNVYTEVEYNRLKSIVDDCITQNGWLILVSHANDPRNYNGYYNDFVYPTERTGDRLNYKDDNYPEEWRVPLKYDEINSMDANNYWEVPPARLNIQSWADWYPCPGTTPALLYDILKYAVEQNVEFVSTEEGLKRYNNTLSVGYKCSLDGYYPVADDYLIDHTKDEYKAYCIIGADGSVNIKSNN